MKKILLGLVLTLALTSAFAKHGPAGCGLGSVVLKGKKGVFWNVLAATTNGTSGNQTFGMSTGTLGCKNTGKAKVSAVSFVEANFVALSNDVARGQGSTLSAYIQLIEAKNVDTTKLQSNFKTIFTKGSDAKTVHNRIMNVING